MTAKHFRTKNSPLAKNYYAGFDQLDGSHPWMTAVPEGHVAYQVRELRDGQVVYFNYALAKEMGLIPESHPHEMSADLEAVLLKTFSIQIINEYDELTKRRFDPATIKPNKYMATRYLQLQHSNKQGKTSGDGRGIWNGVSEHRGRFWDVSSRGTGVTCLSPGAVEANRPLRTGGTDFGYGCGQAEIDELISAALLAEAVHLQGINTERVLCVIDLGKGVGIGVRAALNLIRPAHIFLYLKQENYDALKRATDYLIDRQTLNERWNFKFYDNRKYDELLRHVCDSFADFTAKLDSEYIFAWLDWDGDNVLADAGIIDYGSVRQFGLRHDQYRYDDVERFSTNLNEQPAKAALTVQVFAQLCEYLKTKRKRPLNDFANHPIVKRFKQRFTELRKERVLYRMGFTPQQRRILMQKNRKAVERLIQAHDRIERAKIAAPMMKVGDGINRPALFNIRKALTSFTDNLESYAERPQEFFIAEEDFLRDALSSYARRKDLKGLYRYHELAREFQDLYRQLIFMVTPAKRRKTELRALHLRVKALNSPQRMTGNALIEVVDEILTQRRRGFPVESLQGIVDRIIGTYLNLPEIKKNKFYAKYPALGPVRTDLIAKVAKIIIETNETI